MKAHLLKRAFACMMAVMMLVGTPFTVLSEEAPEAHEHDIMPLADDALYCEDCGGTPKFEYTSANWMQHVRACPHGVEEPGSYGDHDKGSGYLTDDFEHYYVCSVCGIEWRRSAHLNGCLDREHCNECGAAYRGGSYAHDYSNDVQSDEEEHWRVCAACGEEIYREAHYASKLNATVCDGCGRDLGTVLPHVHSWGQEYGSNATEHWRICEFCGEPQEYTFPHYNSCVGDQTKCVECGVAFTGNVEHMPGGIVADVNTHYRLCRDCGEKVYESKHYARCDDKTHCVDCGAAFTPDEDDLNHFWSDGYKYDETGHWHYCEECGYALSKSEHRGSCLKPTVCYECGQPCEDLGGPGHRVNGGYQSDAENHWLVCMICGEKVSLEAHSVLCNEPGKCYYCGAATTSTQITHEWDWGNYLHDDTYHWLPCRYCDATTNKDTHYANCENPTRCRGCGAEVSGIQLSHEWDWDNFQYDDTKHWVGCKNCDARINEYNHYVYCGDTTHCGACGAEVEGYPVLHDWDWDTLVYDDTHHWYACAKCGEPEYKAEHYSSCVDAGVCYECGKPIEATDWVGHRWRLVNDDTYHWNACERCGEEREKEAHAVACNETGVCAYCRAVTDTTEITHWWNWDVYEHDETGHWNPCLYCDATNGPSEHYAYCDEDRDACRACGGPMTQGMLYHSASERAFNENGHWWACVSCGDPLTGIDEHIFDEAGVCVVCGYEMTEQPTATPTATPTARPTAVPTLAPTAAPTATPTAEPTEETTAMPTAEPTEEPTVEPTEEPVATEEPTTEPTEEPTAEPTEEPGAETTLVPPVTTEEPDETPAVTAEPGITDAPEVTKEPTVTAEPEATEAPTAEPTEEPTLVPPVTVAPTVAPTKAPTPAPTAEPTAEPAEEPEDEEEIADEEIVFVDVPVVEEMHGVSADSHERMGVALVTAAQAIDEEYGESAAVEIRHAEKVLTRREHERLQKLPTFERLMVMLDVLGYEEEVDNALEEMALTLSGDAQSLIDEVLARIAAMSEEEYEALMALIAELFPNEDAQVALILMVGGEQMERYQFTEEDGVWLFTQLAIAQKN